MGVEIREHFEDLMKIAEKCDVVAEFGVQHAPSDGSTHALLRGVKEVLHSVEIDPQDYEHVEALAKFLGKQWVLHVGDSKKVELPPVDFLFIDSEHSPSQVVGELEAHASNVRRYIGFHDTHPCIYGAFPDYAAQVFAWMAEHPEWELFMNKANNCGLTVYRRL